MCEAFRQLKGLHDLILNVKTNEVKRRKAREILKLVNECYVSLCNDHKSILFSVYKHDEFEDARPSLNTAKEILTNCYGFTVGFVISEDDNSVFFYVRNG